MICPFCRTGTLRPLKSGDVEIDRCAACGSYWFDDGEVRELTEGRLEVEPEGGAKAPSQPAPDADRALLRNLFATAPSLSCPRCGGSLHATSYQETGAGVLRCRDCRGLLVPHPSAAGISRRVRYFAKHGEAFHSFAVTVAEASRQRFERKHPEALIGQSTSKGELSLPIFIPVSDSGEVNSWPFATWGLILVLVLLHFTGSGECGWSSAAKFGAILPPGAGLAGRLPGLFAFSFFHGGIVPLVVSAFFLFVVGDNVEDRIGRIPFLLLFLGCGVVAGLGHLLLGSKAIVANSLVTNPVYAGSFSGMSGAMGAAGAVAGILGAYLVFFPNVTVQIYGMGRMMALPAYAFACAWAVVVFLQSARGPLDFLLNPAPLSLPGHLGGFLAGVLFAAWYRSQEEALPTPPSA